MASDTALILGAVAVGGIGYYLWKNQNKPLAVPPVPGNPTPGYNIPTDLLGTMQRAYYSANQPQGATLWINAMQHDAVPASASAWNYVYIQWIANYYTTGGGWPLNTQLTAWLTSGIQNYG